MHSNFIGLVSNSNNETMISNQFQNEDNYQKFQSVQKVTEKIDLDK